MHDGNRLEAARLWRRAVEVYENLDRAPRIASDDDESRNIRLGLKGTLENLAVFSYEVAQYEESEFYFRQALAVSRVDPCANTCSGLCNFEMFLDALAKQGKQDELRRLQETRS